jgi:hypothetical protein
VILAPGIDACRHRNRGRAPLEQFDFDGYDRLDAEMKREFAGCAWWFETAALTPEQTAAELVAEAAVRAVTLDPTWNAWLRRLHDA